MTADKSGLETVLLRREMGGDEGKDLQRDAGYGNERVPPLSDIPRRGQDIPVELRNLIEGEAMEIRRATLSDHDLSQRTAENALCALVPR